MAGRLEGTVALVTGAASGIGEATALRFAAEGARVAGLDLVEGDRWGDVVATAPAASFAVCDVTDETAVEHSVAEVVERFGHLDSVVNAAGVAGGGPVHMVELEELRRVMRVNLEGTFLVNKHALVPMMAQRSGSIVNIASIEGIEGTEGGSSYNASKGAVVLLTKNMAIDYGRIGIRVNCICPGFIDTPMFRSVMGGMGPIADKYRARHKLGRFGRPEEIAAAALFLASDDASFVTGHPLVVDGGYTSGMNTELLDGLGLA